MRCDPWLLSLLGGLSSSVMRMELLRSTGGGASYFWCPRSPIAYMVATSSF